MPTGNGYSRRPSGSGSSGGRRKSYTGRTPTAGGSGRRPSSKSSSSARIRAERDKETISRKTSRSNKAASKGALLILAVSLIAIKAFSSLPSTVKTSSDQNLGAHNSISVTTTTFANSISSAPSSSSGITGGSVSPDQVVLPQILPSGSSANPTSGAKSSSTTTTLAKTSPSAGSSSSNSLITVRVFNGTTISGAAGKVTDQLAQLGYDVVAPSNSTNQSISVTEIYYLPSYQQKADQLAGALNLSASSVRPMSFSAPIPNIQPSDLNVVLGTDKAS